MCRSSVRWRGGARSHQAADAAAKLGSPLPALSAIPPQISASVASPPPSRQTYLVPRLYTPSLVVYSPSSATNGSPRSDGKFDPKTMAKRLLEPRRLLEAFEWGGEWHLRWRSPPVRTSQTPFLNSSPIIPSRQHTCSKPPPCLLPRVTAPPLSPWLRSPLAVSVAIYPNHQHISLPHGSVEKQCDLYGRHYILRQGGADEDQTS
ncbi:hypothetical protein EJ06DRAFT_192033 [Trichodelitschia bisporula]|uniref:Uncharacterized protein n=1 Tax=Trichodelitschia bisporula TaxID=703511 RepID=A0A6G1I7Q1_9PEZI|nr:hypothetical protein EJ06DRAFT_192033 [Trichodelitschia bisporula]